MLSPKKAATPEAAWEIQDRRVGLPHAWIQWKATDVFMEATCLCGASFSIQGSHAYVIQCPECGKLYMANGQIELIEVETAGTAIVGVIQE